MMLHTSFIILLTSDFFSVPPQLSVFTSGSEVLIEGANVSSLCNVSAYPALTVTWSKLNEDGFTALRSWLI